MKNCDFFLFSIRIFFEKSGGDGEKLSTYSQSAHQNTLESAIKFQRGSYDPHFADLCNRMKYPL